MQTSVTILIYAIIRFCAEVPSQNFPFAYNVIGQAQGLPDRTKLFLEDLSSGIAVQTLDSAFVVNGRFQFSGILQDSLIKAVIRTADGTASVTFWLENTPIQVDIRNKDFHAAEITGSKTQAELDELNSVLMDIANKKEELLQTLKTKSLERDRYDISLHIKEVKKNELAEISTFIKRHKNSIISAEMLRTYVLSFDRKTLLDLYSELSNNVRNSIAGKEIRNNFIYYSNKIKVGDPYIDFEEPDPNGNMIRLSSVKSDLILLEFWASGCGPCRMENPELVRIYRKYKNKGFEILAVSLDRRKEDWIRAIEKDGLPWKHVSDLKPFKNDAVVKYGVMAVPYNFLINREGIVIARDLRGPQLRKKLEELIN
jgi:thiol-disulfide isomerase/thioredoxin